MARIHDLIRQVERINADLASELQKEADTLASRRSFGLNFERHVPEAVELPGRPVRRNDKVRILPPRGSAATADNDRIWRVVEIVKRDSGKIAKLESTDETNEISTTSLEDLVVVAEFRDPIYPGLVSTGKVERGGNKPFHTVINSENFHALEALLFTHHGKVDAIYIDPPYNTGARDWKYNNDYVESEDLYRHSKWLAFMERRLKLAKELLNPDDSVLIVTIDEKEYLRLGLLLSQIFNGAKVQMVSALIKPSGQQRAGEFARTDEFIFFVMIGSAAPQASELSPDWRVTEESSTDKIRWTNLRREGLGKDTRRQDRPTQFYPVYVNADGTGIHSVGQPIPISDGHACPEAPAGTMAVLPIRTDGSDGRWQVSPGALITLSSEGFVRVNIGKNDSPSLLYLKQGSADRVRNRSFRITGYRKDGSVVVDESDYVPRFVPGTQWRVKSHDAGAHGTLLLQKLLGQRTFPYPKSLYAVEDCLRFFVLDKPNATVIDFFAGSGTTAHAVMRLNKQDGGNRMSISVTNNEVSDDEQKEFRNKGLRQGDPDWEARGICDYITKPRIQAAITGLTPEGETIKGDYKFTDEFPMADGFEENVEFFTLTYEAPLRVQSNREFAKIAPLLWMRAGSTGPRIDDLTNGWDVAETYGVILDFDKSESFIKSLSVSPKLNTVFIITDEDRIFESMVRDLPDHVEPVRLYESYLRNFEIDAARSMR